MLLITYSVFSDLRLLNVDFLLFLLEHIFCINSYSIFIVIMYGVSYALTKELLCGRKFDRKDLRSLNS